MPDDTDATPFFTISLSLQDVLDNQEPASPAAGSTEHEEFAAMTTYLRRLDPHQLAQTMEEAAAIVENDADLRYAMIDDACHRVYRHLRWKAGFPDEI